MPNIKSAKKRTKIIAAKTLKNQMFKTSLKTTIKKYEAAVANADKANLEKTYKDAVKKIDKAAARGIVHKNKAARKKSQFAKKYSSAM
jgi:small subunit ribosomal protein S20